MIRHAEVDDFYGVLDCLMKFAEESGYADEYEIDVQSIANTLGVLKTSGCVLVAEYSGEIVGVLLGIISPMTFNHSIYIANELAWYVSPEHSGKNYIYLLNEFENWAKTNGANSIHISSLEHFDTERAHNIYTKKGYVVKEHAYIKVL